MRLKRVGAKKAPIYRLIITDSRNRRDGRAIEELGVYNPTKHPHEVELKEERVAHWLDVGVVLTDTVRTILRKAGLLKTQAA